MKNRFYGIRDNVTLTKDVKVVIGYGDLPTSSATQDTLFDVTKSSPIDPQLMATYHGWFRDLVTPEATLRTGRHHAAHDWGRDVLQHVPGQEHRCEGVVVPEEHRARLPCRLPDRDCNSGTFRSPTVLPFTRLPASPVGGVVKIGNQSVPFVIGGSGPTVLSPTKVVPTVKPHRKPIYRYQRIDG